jgi:hypothetical protein
LQYALCDKAVTMISLSSFHAMLIPILSGMIMLAIGFNFRDKNAGVFAMWVGMLMILATVIYKILAKLNE